MYRTLISASLTVAFLALGIAAADAAKPKHFNPQPDPPAKAHSHHVSPAAKNPKPSVNK